MSKFVKVISIVLQSQQTADNGQTVVALIDGSDATGQNAFMVAATKVRLEAANPAFTNQS